MFSSVLGDLSFFLGDCLICSEKNGVFINETENQKINQAVSFTRKYLRNLGLKSQIFS